MITIAKAIENMSQAFKNADIISYYLDARILTAHAVNQDVAYTYSRPDRVLNENEKYIWSMSLLKRVSHEPVAYITGKKEFYSREFSVNKNVLIPRPDTEVLIEAILAVESSKTHILELGTGSGAVAVTLALELPESEVTATDISTEALDVAKQNANALGAKNILFKQSDWFSSLEQKQYDIIVSNPPYIDIMDEDEIGEMSEETLKYEPHIALFTDCNESYRNIARKAQEFLKPKGKIFVEIGFDQHILIRGIFAEQGLSLYNYYKDLSGIVRVLCFVI